MSNVLILGSCAFPGFGITICTKQRTMRRTAIAAAWVIGATIPLLMSFVFVFGCCVLPFHGVIHKVLPLCGLAVNLMRGEHHHQGTRQTPAPARQKQEPVKRIATEVPRWFRLAVTRASEQHVTASDATTYRSFIALGAIRCDRDVGLHLLVATLLI
jgi:hypothetical protein